MQTAVNASIAAAWFKLPALSGRSPLIRLDQRLRHRRGIGVVRTHEHVSFQPRFQVFHFRRRQMMERRCHEGVG